MIHVDPCAALSLSLQAVSFFRVTFVVLPEAGDPRAGIEGWQS